LLFAQSPEQPLGLDGAQERHPVVLSQRSLFVPKTLLDGLDRKFQVETQLPPCAASRARLLSGGKVEDAINRRLPDPYDIGNLADRGARTFCGHIQVISLSRGPGFSGGVRVEEYISHNVKCGGALIYGAACAGLRAGELVALREASLELGELGGTIAVTGAASEFGGT
jgi:hypothetical protein